MKPKVKNAKAEHKETVTTVTWWRLGKLPGSWEHVREFGGTALMIRKDELALQQSGKTESYRKVTAAEACKWLRENIDARAASNGDIDEFSSPRGEWFFFNLLAAVL
jgi:hypothetical protein